jgi:bifunctional DNA-binding transcriptional regulator/antitoxin component of YhaV-PrlF toxin-antitoxin module
MARCGFGIVYTDPLDPIPIRLRDGLGVHPSTSLEFFVDDGKAGIIMVPADSKRSVMW